MPASKPRANACVQISHVPSSVSTRCASLLTDLCAARVKITTPNSGARGRRRQRSIAELTALKSRPRLKVHAGRTDDPVMMISSEYFILLVVAVAGSALTLYIMRRRVRIGRRSPKF
jgi:hypothetical protein